MIEGAIWRKWVFFYVPMGLFLLFLLFPFYWMVITSVRPDGELYRPWNSVNYNPFWTWKPTWDHVKYLFEETLFEQVFDVVPGRFPGPERIVVDRIPGPV